MNNQCKIKFLSHFSHSTNLLEFQTHCHLGNFEEIYGFFLQNAVENKNYEISHAIIEKLNIIYDGRKWVDYVRIMNECIEICFQKFDKRIAFELTSFLKKHSIRIDYIDLTISGNLLEFVLINCGDVSDLKPERILMNILVNQDAERLQIFRKVYPSGKIYDDILSKICYGNYTYRDRVSSDIKNFLKFLLNNQFTLKQIFGDYSGLQQKFYDDYIPLLLAKRNLILLEIHHLLTSFDFPEDLVKIVGEF